MKRDCSNHLQRNSSEVSRMLLLTLIVANSLPQHKMRSLNALFIYEINENDVMIINGLVGTFISYLFLVHRLLF